MIQATTCGSKAKPFCWSIDGEQVLIVRDFKHMPHVQISIALHILDELNRYVRAKGGIHLSNNVEKLYNGTESDGIGPFLMQHAALNSSQAQVASQVAALLCQAGIWHTNGKKRSIEFFSNTEDCILALISYYKKHI